MQKPDSLKAHLIASDPDLRQNPEKLLIFADEGNIVAAGTGSLSFEYRFKLNIIITDYSGGADAIMVPLLAWIAVYQNELLSNPDQRKTGIGFEMDYNNHASRDISIKLELTERVIVKRGDAGRLEVRHLAEPVPTPDYQDNFWRLYESYTLLAEWHTPTDQP
ncbi:phage tail protein [Glaciimonas immobilis]|uniref:Phage tail protein n=1 Tax=Glaciimonas immobilis TaxID=728004 RepID=A0A840RNW7_9BURK|nr:phage tail protein [Glaciimonas immobilis]KAF3999227.1 phage tail protein [Glaciimonas immobilis]MBB5198686.1 hypothetical protein [Glaciimonas immobilis]